MQHEQHGPEAAAMRPDWIPELLVPPDLAAELIGRQFPQLRGAPVTELAAGWDNIVYLVAGEWVFRFPRRQVAVPGLAREAAALPRIAPRLPLPIPVPELVGTPSPAYPWQFWGARLLTGSELADARLPDQARGEAAAAVGGFLRALHDPGLIDAVGMDLPVDPMRRAESAARVPMTRAALAKLAAQDRWHPDRAVEQLLADAESLGAADPQAAVLAHGDLHIRHLLVNTSGQAAGIIDWGDLCRADPAVDLSVGYAGFSGPARAALLAAYGPVSAERQLRARVLAVFLCAMLAEYAAAEGRPRLLSESLRGIGRAVAP